MNRSLPFSLPVLAERVRFELTDTCASAVFKVDASPHDPTPDPSLAFGEGSRGPVAGPAVSDHSWSTLLPAQSAPEPGPVAA